MDLSKNYFDLVKESFKLRSFKGAGLFPGILAAIALIPYILIYAVYQLFYGLLIVGFKMLNTPFDYVHKFAKNEAKEFDNGLPQGCMVAIFYPFICFVKVFMAILVFFLCLIHMTVSLVGYIATYGGIKFSPFLLDDCDRLSEKRNVEHSAVGTFIFSLVSILFFVLGLVIEEADVASIFSVLYVIFTVVYVVAASVITKKKMALEADVAAAAVDADAPAANKTVDAKAPSFKDSVDTTGVDPAIIKKLDKMLENGEITENQYVLTVAKYQKKD